MTVIQCSGLLNFNSIFYILNLHLVCGTMTLCCCQSLGFTDHTSDVTEYQLTERYRQLVRQYHPDKVRPVTDDERKHVEQRFIVVQQAYEKLSVIKQRRAGRTEL